MRETMYMDTPLSDFKLSYFAMAVQDVQQVLFENCGAKRKDVKMHPFPACEIRLKKWLVGINSDYLRSLSVPKLQKLCVCRKHFEKRFFSEKNRLKIGSYPSLFSADEIASGIPTKVMEENHDLNCSRKRKHDDHAYARLPDTSLAEEPTINVGVSSISDTETNGNVTDDILSQPAVPTASEDSDLGIIVVMGGRPVMEETAELHRTEDLPSCSYDANSLEQLEMSYSPSSFSEDCGLNKEMSEEEPTSTLFCICCLQREVPYIKLWTCSHRDFLENFVMPELKPEDLVICYQCHDMLKRIKLFKQQVEESFKLLSSNVENITKSNQQDRNLQKQHIFSIDIPSTRTKRKLQLIKRVIPQTKRKRANTDIDNLITEEIPKTNTRENPQRNPEQAKMGIDNSFLPNIDKKNKNIEDALKIININQNSGCIDLLATSLKTISYSLLSNINNINFGIGYQIGRNPTDILFSNITPTDNATSISGDNISTENNNTNLAVENQMNAATDILFSNKTSTNDATTISNEDIILNNTIETSNTYLAVENQMNAGILFSNNTSTNDATTISNEDIILNNTESYNTNLAIENQIGRNPTDLLFSINTPTTSKTISLPSRNISTNNTIENNEIIIEDQIENIDIVENVANEELDPLENNESRNGQSIMQTDEPIMKRPSINSNIRQVTLTREQLSEERTKMASSQTFLRLPHRCESCLVGFQFRENLDDHVLRKHTEDKIRNPERCDVCHQFMEACDYDKHLLWHLTRYECVACSQQLASYDEAALHYRKHHRSAKPRPLFNCPKCPYKTQLMCRLKRHIRRITECESCGERITHGCGTGITFNRHTARCKGSRSEPNRAEAVPTIQPCVKRTYKLVKLND